MPALSAQAVSALWWHLSHLGGEDSHFLRFARADVSRTESQKGTSKGGKISQSGSWLAVGLEKDKCAECPSGHAELSRVRERRLRSYAM